MDATRFWLIRHALVEENARATLYGTMDVPLCPEALEADVPMYRALAARLPRPAVWVVTPLSRTALTAAALFRAGYPEQAPAVEAELMEQDLGEWHGLTHARSAGQAAASRPSVLAAWGRRGAAWGRKHGWRHRSGRPRDGAARRAASRAGRGGRQPWRGHPCGGGACHRHRGRQCIALSVQNLSLTRLERSEAGWRVVCVNEVCGLARTN